MTTPTGLLEEAFTALEATSSMDEAVAFARVADIAEQADKSSDELSISTALYARIRS